MKPACSCGGSSGVSNIVTVYYIRHKVSSHFHNVFYVDFNAGVNNSAWSFPPLYVEQYYVIKPAKLCMSHSRDNNPSLFMP